MRTDRRDHPYSRLLLASVLTCWLTGLCFMLDIYPGSPFGPDWTMLSDPRLLLVAILILAIPSSLFALFCVWPLLVVVTPMLRHAQARMSGKQDWSLWIGAGALLGPPALLVYSVPLGLGQTLIANLIISGSMSGVLCAALTRWLIGPEVDDPSVLSQPETTDHFA